MERKIASKCEFFMRKGKIRIVEVDMVEDNKLFFIHSSSSSPDIFIRTISDLLDCRQLLELLHHGSAIHGSFDSFLYAISLENRKTTKLLEAFFHFKTNGPHVIFHIKWVP
jgi:hypothetical protein